LWTSRVKIIEVSKSMTWELVNMRRWSFRFTYAFDGEQSPQDLGQLSAMNSGLVVHSLVFRKPCGSAAQYGQNGSLS
jgi:predicted dithiol-disulfide oxidoreductase (DUF899 family)